MKTALEMIPLLALLASTPATPAPEGAFQKFGCASPTAVSISYGGIVQDPGEVPTGLVPSELVLQGSELRIDWVDPTVANPQSFARHTVAKVHSAGKDAVLASELLDGVLWACSLDTQTGRALSSRHENPVRPDLSPVAVLRARCAPFLFD